MQSLYLVRVTVFVRRDQLIRVLTPFEPANSVHRIGHTGRLGKPGHSTSFIDSELDYEVILPLIRQLAKSPVDAHGEPASQEAQTNGADGDSQREGTEGTTPREGVQECDQEK
ncbi:hypothetical protein PRIPAC_89156 [Pristionchus pacificus]|uniref:Uncharacterized protein n=1 Tax=Pristionchus pacificus TaxID=54126 RepID=A0A2A6B6N8_PRIPA|nr:hypothetical protein PRIPAC_89156 [Pristionchus pacificus]|eukprot:PDM61542.1 hypothetical protein PRIPAC_50984 [Pristionchus pacificus]